MQDIVRGNPTHHQVATLPAPLAPKDNQFEVYICCAQKHMRRGGAIDLVLRETLLSEVLTAGANLISSMGVATIPASNSQIFHQTILSFGAILFGSRQGQTSIVGRGYAMHGMTLRHLNQALSDEKCSTRDEVVLSVAALAILECLVPSGPKNYLKHMLGLERLLALRGPLNYSPISAEIYKSVRHMIIFSSLRTGRPSILAGADWKNALRLNCNSDYEIQEQDLFDFLADCTTLLAERDGLLAEYESLLAIWGSDLDQQKLRLQIWARWRVRIWRRSLEVLASLRAWKETWDSDERNAYTVTSGTNFPTCWTPSGPMGAIFADGLPPLDLTFYSFSSGPVAFIMMLYNTTLIYIFRILASLPSGNLETALDAQPPWEHNNDEYFAAERSTALEVFRCVPYLCSIQLRSDFEASPISHWAVTTAWTTLRSNGNESNTKGEDMIGLLEPVRQGRGQPEIVAQGVWEG
ncbi:hypothetical protein DRE_02929 [Drechslerella stenobrocha 248]|uniref:Transcription factor domain-containing protein n=1 Tax=Drechslerella stenobrocha 248 TaxID=1043628 RepID=W7HW19_9PEZI|nr:hypothetical protein DRE_02929 [Drechslerella stenobrocha 248]